MENGMSKDKLLNKKADKENWSGKEINDNCSSSGRKDSHIHVFNRSQNEFDDQEILSSKIRDEPNDSTTMATMMHGRYGGVFVYTTSATVPENIVAELERAAKRVGRDFNKFIRTDNACGPKHPLVQELEKKVEEKERTTIKEVE